MPSASYNVYYAGWDRSGTAPAGGVGIHHPNADVKAISFSGNPLTTVDSCIGSGRSTHWQVIWTSGVTEVGSSGSGIWDPATHKLVGTLSGGQSVCSSLLFLLFVESVFDLLGKHLLLCLLLRGNPL